MGAADGIYLDCHATTPCDPRVVEAMAPLWRDAFGNAASAHAFGWRARDLLEEARAQVAALIGAAPQEIVFTSGATESNNLAIVGALRARSPRSRGAAPHVIVSAIEHPSVLDPVRALRRAGVRVSAISVGRDGRVDPQRIAEAIEPDTVLISVMHANNEIGTVQPVAAIAEHARARGVWLHSDAAQSAGRLPIDVRTLGADLLSLSAHKLYGPMGVGALYVRSRRPRIELEPLQRGGSHERGLRSGTAPVPLCVGFGVACDRVRDSREADRARIDALTARLWGRLCETVEGLELNGSRAHRLPGSLNLWIPGVEAQALLAALPDVALSSGSACTSAKPEPSHVLRALGLPPARALSSLRIGLGRFTTQEEVDRAAERIACEVARLRELSPAWPPAGRAGGTGRGAKRDESGCDRASSV